MERFDPFDEWTEPDESASRSREPLTVGQVSEHIKALLDRDPVLAQVAVRGEVSNCRPYASGHWYFSLKDGDATLSCVMWKWQAKNQEHLPEDGGEFVMHGNVSAYPAQGRYQLYVERVEPVGQGDLHQRFEALKAKLAEEGLFDAERKRPLPPFPMKIGIVTSRQAAALRDVLQVLGRRWPVAEVLLSPTLVQGDSAPPKIVKAIQAIEQTDIDLLIVTRGGGSLEDLWAFNDETVARAIAACPVPVISGVGHEIDFSIADFAADLRAPTPSAAAELATPDANELRMSVDAGRQRLDGLIGDRLNGLLRDVEDRQRRLVLASPARRIGEQSEKVEAMRERLARAVQALLRLRKDAISSELKRLEALNPQAVLDRGYAHVTRGGDGTTVSSADDVSVGEGLRVRVSEGSFDAVVAGQASMGLEGGEG